MYKVMIVDDDADVCEYLIKIINWEELTITFSCSARDGASALELYPIYKPKIVIIDICMPSITGIELAKRLCKKDSEIRVILITGFTDFQYAKKAVSMGAIDLLSKPLVPEEVNISLKKAINYFEERKKEYQKSIAIQNLVSDNIEILLERKLLNLMETEPKEKEWSLREQMRFLGCDFYDAYYTVIAISFQIMSENIADEETYPIFIRKTVEMRLSEKKYSCKFFFDGQLLLKCLVSSKNEESNEHLEEILTSLSEELFFYLDMRFMIGIGETVNKMKNIFISSQQALAALKYLGSFDESNIINYKNIKSVIGTAGKLYNKKINMLKEILPFFHIRDYSGIVSIFDKWGNNIAITFEDIRDFSIEYISCMNEECQNAGIRMSDQKNYSSNMRHVFSSTNISQLKTSLLCLTENTLSILNQKFKEDRIEINFSVNLAKQYIQDNLGNKKLNLATVSSHVALSKNYFGRMFLGIEKMSVNAYINKVRIEFAKKLLIETTDKIYEISDKVGYNNAKSFSYAFKAYSGISPLDYRRSK